MSHSLFRDQRNPRSKSANCHDRNAEAEGNESSDRGARSFMSSDPSGCYYSPSRLPTALATSTPKACKLGFRGVMAGSQESPLEMPSSILESVPRERPCSPAFRKNDRFQHLCQRYQKQKSVPCPHAERRSASPPPVARQYAHYGSDNVLKLDEKAKSAISHLSQIKETPSHFKCDLNQGLDFLKSFPKPRETLKPPKKFPEIPCLRENDLFNLIKCENEDVESANYLAAEQKKTYKKPCPKQQKAQMMVKALMQAHAIQISGKENPPLEHPDPEDISPELAATMMFLQEKGIKMEDCPDKTITSLFPDEKSPYLLKSEENSISVVDSRDQEDMIEKSASVPSEGVSDSAYTRTMRDKGDYGAQKSFDVDFAIGQSKREYVVLAQKPQRVNKVQYRGGHTPSWFPGYFSAFPNEDGIKIVPSPSRLFHKAWVQSNPKNIPASDIIIVD